MAHILAQRVICKHSNKMFISSLIETVYGAPQRTHTHTNLVGPTERDRLHLMIQQTAFPPRSTSRSHISSHSHRCLLQWYTIDLLSPHMTERKMLEEGQKDIEAVRREGRRTILLMLPSRVFAVVGVTLSSAELGCFLKEHILMESTSKMGQSSLLSCAESKPVWKVKWRGGTLSHFHQAEFYKVVC